MIHLVRIYYYQRNICYQVENIYYHAKDIYKLHSYFIRWKEFKTENKKIIYNIKAIIKYQKENTNHDYPFVLKMVIIYQS